MKDNRDIKKNYIIGIGSLLSLSGEYFMPSFLTYNYNRNPRVGLLSKSWLYVGSNIAKSAIKVKSDIIEEMPEVKEISEQVIYSDPKPFIVNGRYKPQTIKKIKIKRTRQKGRIEFVG